MRPLQLSLAKPDYDELPRHPAYRYEYIQGMAWITPLPRFHHCRLDLATGPADDGQTCPWEGTIRPLVEADWALLPEVFAIAFRGIEPFSGLSHASAVEAARASLDQTRLHGDGPLIAESCWIAELNGQPIGAALVTLLPLTDPTSERGYFWQENPPADAVETRQGRPHLTWIFVRHPASKRGVGLALLSAVCGHLQTMGFGELLSTVLDGNTPSMLWHWRMGFTLLQHAESHRRMNRAY